MSLNQTILLIVANIIIFAVLIFFALERRSDTIAINDEIYDFETRVFGEGNKPKANLKSFPGRIRALEIGTR